MFFSLGFAYFRAVSFCFSPSAWLTSLSCPPCRHFLSLNRCSRQATQNQPTFSPTRCGIPKLPLPQRLRTLHQLPKPLTAPKSIHQRKGSCQSGRIIIHMIQTTSTAQAGAHRSDQTTTQTTCWRLHSRLARQRQSRCSRETGGSLTLVLQQPISKRRMSRCRTQKPRLHLHCTTTEEA